MIERKMVAAPTMDSMIAVQGMIEETMEEVGLPLKITMKIGIVVDEIYSNIVRFSQASEAEVLCRADEGKIELYFMDNGIPFNPLEMEEPDTTLAAEDRAIGGLGVLIYKKIMDQVSYRYEEGKNKLELMKSI